jgi:hypothetical protein
MKRSHRSIVRALIIATSLSTAVLSSASATAQSGGGLPPGTPGNASKAETAALLAALCEGRVSGSTCRKCPTGTDTEAGLPISVGPYRVGSFTAPGAKEALVRLYGCDTNPAQNRGTVLLRQGRGGAWKVLRYDSGVDTENCLAFPYQTKGVTLLVCEGFALGQGYMISSAMAVYVGPKKSTVKPVVTATDNSGACENTVDILSLVGWRQRDFDGDKIPDLQVTVDEAHAENKNVDKCQSEQKAGKSVRYDVSFRFDGTRFTATPGSKATVDCMAGEASNRGKYCPVPPS